jgi:hypothetical protein
MSTRKAMPRWPLFLIAAPACVAIWAGWVGLGQMAGFGLVTPLPGIVPWHLDTAITLPIGVEAYAAYALGAWLGSWPVPEAARAFARRSAIGALILGMTGQVIFHLLAAAHATRAPWPVVVIVSCMPVVVLGFGTALTHLLRADDAAEAITEATAKSTAESTTGSTPETTVKSTTEAIAESTPEPAPRSTAKSRARATRKARPGGIDAATREAIDAATQGHPVPSARALARDHHIGRDKASQVRAAVLAGTNGDNGHPSHLTV